MNRYESTASRTAVVTGASRGLGLALTRRLVEDGWHVLADARDGGRLVAAVDSLPTESVTVVPGDLSDPGHRAQLAAAAIDRGDLALLVNNASILAGSPQPRLADLRPEDFTHVLAVNTVAPLDLIRRLLPQLVSNGGVVVNVSSDAAAEAYEGWGAYAASKAALDHASAVLAVEEPDLDVYAVDPGDMATDLHQQAFPGEDISDRPSPETVVPALLSLLTTRPPSGRYRSGDLLAATRVPVAAEAL